MKVKALTTDGGMIIGNEYEVTDHIFEILSSVNRVCKSEDYVVASKAKIEAVVKEVKTEGDGMITAPLNKKSKK